MLTAEEMHYRTKSYTQKIHLWCETVLQNIILENTGLRPWSEHSNAIVTSDEIPDTSVKNFCSNQNLKVFLVAKYLKEFGYKTETHCTRDEHHYAHIYIEW